MGRNSERERYDDYDKHHRRHHRESKREYDDDDNADVESNRHKYSLLELKERARREAGHRREHHHHHHHRSRHERYDDDTNRRHSRSRSRDRQPNQKNTLSYHRSGSPSRRKREHTSSPNDNIQRTTTTTKNNTKKWKDDRPRYGGGGYGKDQVDEPNTSGGETKVDEEKPAEIKPNFEVTGALAKDTNMFNGVLVKYNEPPEAKKPNKRWRFYPFKGDTPLDFIPLHRQSAYLFGRDRRVVDVPLDHPSCSKQHAALQYRSVEVTKEDGTVARVTRPYIIDLDSGNGTFVNNKIIEPRRYVELLEQDVVKFGFSTREYVLLHEQSHHTDEQEEE